MGIKAFTVVTGGRKDEESLFRALHDAVASKDADAVKAAAEALDIDDKTRGLKTPQTILARIKAGRRSCYNIVPVDENGKDVNTYAQPLHTILQGIDPEDMPGILDSIMECQAKQSRFDSAIRAAINGGTAAAGRLTL